MNLENIEYFVNKENGTVVAKCKTDIEFDALKEVNNIFSKTVEQSAVNIPAKALVRVNSRPILLTGIAHCHPNDEFDEEKGKQIARKRLVKQYFKKKAHIIKNYKKLLEAIIVKLDDSIHHSNGVVERINNNISKF